MDRLGSDHDSIRVVLNGVGHYQHALPLLVTVYVG